MSFAQPGNDRDFFGGYNATNNQSGGYGQPSDPSDKWNKLQQKCFQTLTTISTQTSQVKRMIPKIGSYEDSLDFRSKMYVKKEIILIKIQLSLNAT